MKDKGITLLALVITIIILLILAAVTLNLTIGENGVFTKAKYAKEQYEKAQEKEQKQLNELYSEMKIATNGEITVNVEDLKEIIQQEVKEELAKENQSKNPTGTIISYMGNKAPEGYLFCNGGVYNISEYSELAEQIKNEFGSYSYFGGDGETTFALPDLRGEFLRGTGTGARNTGTGNAVGSHQDATFIPRIGSAGSTILATYGVTDSEWDVRWMSKNFDVNVFSNSWQRITDAYYGSLSSSTLAGGTVRTTNTAVLYCIKY